MKSVLFPYQMLQFAAETFDHNIVQYMFGSSIKDQVALSQNIK
jgi:hypothetical protein